ncbi:MAG: tRNA (N6-threonylcarbamoyladenosine(37)-N6)-methyltransferase TrmO [Desulfobacteraceae bacterium]|nr:tRNA (N6-threonylcarbamoyladenosine(37)-N6)-methyltransferase TrmO [Desulfobacteraceae bacterium]MBC2755601.1 tRNA (N6-threonylcarbamoyladenosine(37)-N6)-methyltransferase TrmO [Desulfobacteraceae bacterium]
MNIKYTPIGIIHSPYTKPEGMPIQPTGAKGIEGTVEVFETFEAGLKDLDGFSHIILLYCFHRSEGYHLETVPFLDKKPHGVFATRAPKRPNPIGLSIVKLNRIEGRILYIENIDVLDNTPLLDIKPYVPDFDTQPDVRTGWLENVQKTDIDRKSDDRFSR